MKNIYVLLIIMTINVMYGQCEDEEYSTVGVLTDINESVYNDDESVNAYSIFSWTSDDTDRILSGNGIPNHEVGTFPNPNNPNTISEQNVNQTFSLCPALVSETGVQVGGPAGAIAYAINSVKFDPATAGRCDDDGVCSLAQGQGQWNIEALGHETFDFGDDMNHAHVQPSGEYHYHGMPELLIDLLEDDQSMTLVGWASDGFPVYARYGYADANDSGSEVISLQPSWRLKTEPDEGRPDTLTALEGGPGQGTIYPNIPIQLGAFTQDFEYVEGHGDLDECNGRIGVTPEFPEGIYYYIVTDDFPYFSRCLKGDFAGGGGGGVPNCEDVPPGNPCCGDGVCGGPETEDNCPSDCGNASVAPELDNFSLSADSVNTSTTAVTVIYTLSASDPDDYLLNYTVRLILNGGPVNGGEIMEISGDFNSNLSSSNVSGAFVFPIGTTEGQWNARVLIHDESNNLTNLGPNELAEKNFQSHIIVDNTLLGSEKLNTLPMEFALLPNYPNPFNPSTTIRFHVPIRSNIDISVFDILGNHVETIINSEVYPGIRSIVWAPDRSVVSGMYFIRLKSDHFTSTQKVILLK
jgi:hypothetical protein